MCSKHGWLPYQLAKISLSFSLPVHNWMPPENGIVGQGHHTMVLVSLTVFSQWSSVAPISCLFSGYYALSVENPVVVFILAKESFR